MMLTVQTSDQHQFTNLTMKVGKNVDRPLKDSMHALIRLFLWSPDDDKANAGGVSMITPAACPVDARNETGRFVISSSKPPCVGHTT